MYHLSNSKIPNVENPKSKLEKAACAQICFSFIWLNYIFRIFKCNMHWYTVQWVKHDVGWTLWVYVKVEKSVEVKSEKVEGK